MQYNSATRGHQDDSLDRLLWPPSLRLKHNIPPFSLRPHTGRSSATINWTPDVELFNERLERAGSPSTDAELPEGWPEYLDSPLAWYGEDLTEESAFVYNLSDAEKEEVHAALEHCKEITSNPGQIDRDCFPLPNLGPALAKASEVVHQGIGFYIIRGLDPTLYSEEDNAMLFVGLSSYIAARRGYQYSSGEMFAHIFKVPEALQSTAGKHPIYSNKSQPFHSDVGTDILALYKLNSPVKDGRIMLASSWTVYNEMARLRPDLISTLARDDWIHNTFGQEPPVYYRPLMFYKNGKMLLNFSRRVITGNNEWPRYHLASPLDIDQANALDMVHFTATKHSRTVETNQGDMLFVNNFGILHSRESFEDDEHSRRHLLRLWLRNDEMGWDIPDDLELEWDKVFYKVDEKPEIWNLLADPGEKSSSCG